MGALDITQKGTGHTISLGFGGSMILDQGTLTVHNLLRKPVKYALSDQRCAGLTCLIAMQGSGKTRGVAAMWRIRLWRDSRNSMALCGGYGPDISKDHLGEFLATTDEQLEATAMGRVARLLDDAIVAAPRATPPPHLEVGTYFPNVGEQVELLGQIVWVPSLGLAVLDHGSRPPTAPTG